MILRGKKFVKESPMFEIDLKKTDSYTTCITKISEVINIDETDCVLTSRGCIIPDEMIQAGDKWQLWTLGGYLNKRRIAPEKLILGIGHRSNCCIDKPPIKKKKNGIQNNF